MTETKHQLLATTAVALSFAIAAPAAAQTAAAPKPGAPVSSASGRTKGTIRPFAPVAPDLTTVDVTAAGKGDRGTIRPFTPVAPDADLSSEVRLVPMAGKGDRGVIRPFGGPFLLHDGRYTAFAGDIVGTSSRIRAFEDTLGVSSSRIRAFAGELNGLSSRIRAFWSDPAVSGTYSYTPTSNTFWGTQYSQSSSLLASSSRIRAFDGNLEAYSSRIRAFADGLRSVDGTLKSFDSAPTNYTGIRNEIFTMVAATKGVWGSAVTAQTGKTFEDGFSNRMLSKWGINLSDARSIAGLNEVDLELFLLDWRDNVMLFSGVDSVDHWMKAINWTPSMTHQAQSGLYGAKVKVGLLDFSVTGDPKANVIRSAGISQVAGAHGNAVASLIVGAHDGRGVMGLAPRAEIVAWNPFDATESASWTHIKAGLNTLGTDAHVINLSLGVPGWTFHPDWKPVLGDSAIKSKIQDGVFVIAAGNDGFTQTKNVDMTAAFDSTFLVVGSVDPNNVISNFSNRPGNVCLTDGFVCKNTARWTKSNPWFVEKSDYIKESGLLMNRFLVAPGELMLVDDGTGNYSAGVKSNVTRLSGTSFAAPLVSGTVALIAERWPWLLDKPLDVAHIILSSARDLGEPGTDPVYGRGMLDVEAAMSPLDWNKVTIKQSLNGGALTDTTLATLRNTSSYTRSTWDYNRAYFYVFENTTSSWRDFYVPMSSKLVGMQVGSNRDQMNWYLRSRFQAALGSPTRFAGTGSDAFGAQRFSAPMAGFGDLAASVSVTPKAWRPGLRQSTSPFDTAVAFQSASGRVAMRFGSGVGGADVDGQRGFALQSDYDVLNGGANPFLGLASGAAYAAADVALGDRLTLTAGVSNQSARRDTDQMPFQDRVALGGLDAYQATASVLSARYRATGWLTATASYTMLDEGAGLLGTQSLDASDFAHGSTTDAATIGADVTPGHGLTFSVSGTLGRTREADLGRQNMGVADGGLVSSAFQVALSKNGLFDGSDRARVTLAQPLHVESGSVAVNQVKVVDRTTGRLGTEVETFELNSGTRRFVAEAMYGRSMLDGRGELSLFGRADLKSDAAAQPSMTVGGSMRLSF
ncbi:S8 family peptidase [Sphingomonas lenta]|uniref:Peptidase S8/S53 domain-containing protein n=1 Tax=Sphingomonas lenta TaxID=1141887 RepID=A0A2A2SD60_9SPHN|nr:S8 family peptidase [Sphingomonas lenta]PAX07197.1 hypothetical protein CKY28_14265 [Sphingomonas lenta]